MIEYAQFGSALFIRLLFFTWHESTKHQQLVDASIPLRN